MAFIIKLKNYPIYHSALKILKKQKYSSLIKNNDLIKTRGFYEDILNSKKLNKQIIKNYLSKKQVLISNAKMRGEEFLYKKLVTDIIGLGIFWQRNIESESMAILDMALFIKNIVINNNSKKDYKANFLDSIIDDLKKFFNITIASSSKETYEKYLKRFDSRYWIFSFVLSKDLEKVIVNLDKQEYFFEFNKPVIENLFRRALLKNNNL